MTLLKGYDGLHRAATICGITRDFGHGHRKLAMETDRQILDHFVLPITGEYIEVRST
jgi:hypothetical protein